MEEETTKKIQELVDDIKAFINMDGGDIEFIKYEEIKGVINVDL